MIHTLTLDPSLDYIVKVDPFELGELNYAQKGIIRPGGKGINVSIVLSRLGVNNIAYGFVAGFTGSEIEHRLQELNCRTSFIHINEGTSRINIKLKATEETEINGIGPDINDSEFQKLIEKLDKIESNDILVLSGGVSKSLSDDVYRFIIDRVSSKGVMVVLDAAQKSLLNALPCHPFLIKPNSTELSKCLNIDIKSLDDVVEAAQQLRHLGARNVLVSLADKGAVLVTETGESFYQTAPSGKTINSVGAGDSMVAGFIEGYLRTNDYQQALKMGIACGSASAFSEWLPEKKDIDDLYASL